MIRVTEKNIFSKNGTSECGPYPGTFRWLSLILVILKALHDNGDVSDVDDDDDEGCGARKKALFPSPHTRGGRINIHMFMMNMREA